MSDSLAKVNRTQDEIVAEMHATRDSGADWLGTRFGDLFEALDWEHAQEFLRDDHSLTEAKWLEDQTTDPAARIREYLPFAIGKAEDHRGLSAGRSVTHLIAWAWLAGDEHEAVLKEADYSQYGAPVLRAAAGLVGATWPDTPQINRMAEGEPCEPGCMEGCGE